MKYALVVAGIVFGFLLGVYSGQKQVMKYESLVTRSMHQTKECLSLLEQTETIQDGLNSITGRLSY